jgi:hypothetical protein
MKWMTIESLDVVNRVHNGNGGVNGAANYRLGQLDSTHSAGLGITAAATNNAHLSE